MNTNTTRFAATTATTNSAHRNSGSRSGPNTHHHSNAMVSRKTPSQAQTTTTATAGAVTSPGLESLEALRVPLTATIPTLDPTSQAGLIQVPVALTAHTKGRTEFFQGLLKKEVSLCCLFQKGRCHAGEKCHQIHVDSQFMKNIRAQNAHVISCCRQCKDTASLTPNAATFFATHFGSDSDTVKVVSPDGSYSTVKCANIAITIGLTQHAEQQQLKTGGGGGGGGSSSVTFIPAKKMCRLHLRGACKYGRDCKNVHLCSKLGEAILVPTKTPSTTTEEEKKKSRDSHGSPVATPPPASITVAQQSRLTGSLGGLMDRTTTSCSSSSSAATPRVIVGATTHTAAFSSTRRSSAASTASAASVASIASDAPKDYFSAERFQTPPTAPVAVGSGSIGRCSGSSAPAPEAAVSTPSDSARRLSFSQVDLSNISFMENSVAINDLCFDPAMALWDEVSAVELNHQQPKQLSGDWLADEMCGCSLTTSPTPTPSKMTW